MNKTACFIGHRKIIETEELTERLYKTIENLVIKEKVYTFLFGSKSEFDSLCLEIVTNLKEKHPFIKRVFVRAEYPVINDSYLDYLYKFYDDTYFSKSASGAGRASYVKRNYEMINKSDFCVFYYNEESLPKGRKSGTKLALSFAKSKKKNLYVFPSSK